MPDSAARPTPKVSVLCAVHNGLPWLPAAVESILRQTFTDFEFIIVDDASDDGTAAYLANLTDPRVRLIRQEENQGLTISLLSGLAQARGSFIARQDADDLSLPDRFRQQVAHLDAYPETLLISGRHQEFIGESPPLNEASSSELPSEEISFAALLTKNMLCHSSVMFRREILADGLTYRTAFSRSQDYDLWLRIALTGRIVKLGDLVCLYRRRPEAISLLHLAAQLRLVEQARILARQRQESGTDELDQTRRLPELSPAQETIIRHRMLDTFAHFSIKAWQAGDYLAAWQLFLRGMLRHPLLSLRGWLGRLFSDKA